MSKPDPSAAEPVEEASAPGYSIRVVARMTGIPADTLRMWERRYGFPKPLRSNSGIRAYRADDVEKLQLIVRAMNAGHRPGQIVPLGKTELERLVKDTAPAMARPIEEAAPSSFEAILESLVKGDLVSVHRAIRQSVTILGARGFLTQFALPLCASIGSLWESGKLEVRHEHLVTAALSTQIRILLATYENVRARPAILFATLPGEEHALPSEMTALYATLEGAHAELLGASAPAAQIAEAARELGADVVGLSLVRQTRRGELDESVRDLLAGLPRGMPLWLGGSHAADITVEDPRIRRIRTWEDLGAEVRSAARK